MKPTVTRCPTCKRKHKRSNPANARYWLLLHQMERLKVPVIDDDGEFVLDKNGKKIMTTHPAESWHRLFKRMYIGITEHRLPNGRVIEELGSSSELDVSEFNDYMMRVEAFAAERGVYLEHDGGL